MKFLDNTRSLWYTTPMPKTKTKAKIVSHKPKFLPLNRPVKGTVALQVHFDTMNIEEFDSFLDIEAEVQNDLRLRLGKKFADRIVYAGDGGLAGYYMEWEGKPKDMARLARWFRESDRWPVMAIHTVEIFKI